MGVREKDLQVSWTLGREGLPFSQSESIRRPTQLWW